MRKALLFTLVGSALALGPAASVHGERLAERRAAVSLAPEAATAARAVAPCAAAACPNTLLGALELPVEGSTVSGYVQIRGFALNGNQISQIDVYVDGTDEANRVTAAGAIKLQVPRPDVMQAGKRKTRRGSSGFLHLMDGTICCMVLIKRRTTGATLR